MNLFIQQANAEMRAEPDENAPVLLLLNEGDRAELLGVVEGAAKSWVRIQVGAQVGFVLGNTKVFVPRNETLMQKLVVYSEPSKEAEKIYTIRKGETIAMLEPDKPGSPFIKIRTQSGIEGWVLEKFRVHREQTRESIRNSLILGVALLGLGVWLNASDLGASLTSPRSLLQWVSLILGAYKIGQGALTYYRMGK